MTRSRVFVTHWVHPEVLEELSRECNVAANRTLQTMPRAELLSRARDARAVMAFMPDRIDREWLDACPSLGLVAGAFKGSDNVDVEACTARGVWVTTVPDLLTEPTAELAVMLLLGLSRRVREADAVLRSGGFRGWRPILFGSGVAGRTIGILGMGAVGQGIAARLSGFSCSLLYHDEKPLAPEQEQQLSVERSPFADLLGRSDHVVLALPLTARTNSLIDARALAAFKPGAGLVNVGRGSVVDERAVAAALQAGRLGGYASDVFACEDHLQPGRPESIPPELLHPDLPTLFTPHLGSAVEGTRLAISQAAARSILEFLRGETPVNAVNRPQRASATAPRMSVAE